MRVLIGICLVLAVSGYAAAEEAMFDWEMREWTSSDGLPDGYVADLSKDPQGFVWIATYGGLCRFDGKEFVNFSKLRVEEHPDVPVMPTALWKSPTGTIWIGDAEGGIVTYKNGGFEKLVLESEWSKQLIVEFECDQDGNVWVLDSMGNLVRFSDGFYLPVVSYQDGLPTGSSLAKDKASGMLYAAIRGYLWRLSGGEPELVGFPDSEVQGTIETIGPGWKSGIWLFRWDNLMKVEGGTIVEDIHFDADNMGGSPGRLFEYMDGRMGFSTKDKGLFLTSSLDPFESKLISNPNYSSVQCFELDEPGVIWVGYVAEGMACLTEVSYKRLVAPDRWKRRPIKSVNVDKRGDVWVGTEGSGLYHYSQGQWRVYDYTNGLSSDYVWAIGDAPNHELWVGTWGKGVYKIEENGPNRLSFWPDEKPSVTAIEFDDSGGAWIGTSLGLIGVRNDSLAVYDQTTGIRSPNVRTVETTDDGDVWFGMMGGGLGFLSKNGQFRQFDESDGMSDRNVGALYYDHDHSLWVGSYHGGLMRYREGLFSIIDVNNGLMSNDIASIHEDRTGRLWFSSSEGVFSVEKKELIDCAEGRMDEIAFTLAGAGLGDLKCVSGTKHCADIGPDGTLYYATRDEIVMVRPELQEARNIRIRPVVEGLWMDGVGQLESSSNVDDQHKIKVAPGGRRFEFRFSVPSFVSPSSIKCQYLLDGVDPGWLEAGEMRSLVYQNLSPGSYTFQLRAGIRGQKHLTEGESIAFEVLPFWWERISVRIGAILSLMSILFGGIHWRIASVNREEKRRLEREKALERERMRIARDLHDDLGSSITHISQLSGQPLMGESRESMEVMLHRIRKISSESVRQMDEIVWAVNPRHDSLDSLADYMIQYSQSFLEDAGIACRIDVPFDLPDVQVSAEIRHNFFLICKEALNNIVKHSGAEQVCISLAWVDACIVCSITDNGRGLGQDALGSSSGRISDGNGIRIIRERIRTVGGECSWDASESGGVTFAFRIPVGS